MKLDVEYLISLINQFSTPYSDLNEEDETPPPSDSGGETSSGGKGYPSVTKWETGVKRGKSNPIGNTKWAQGHTIGKANPSGPRDKWSTGVSRGKSNTLL